MRIDPTYGATRVLRVGRIMIVMLSIVFIGMIARVAQLQTRPSAAIAGLLDSQKSTRHLMGRRGALLDRRGRPLAVTRVAHRLFIDPLLIRNRKTFPEHVAQELDYDPVWIEQMISARSSSRYVVIDHRISDHRMNRLTDLNIPGLAIEPILVRDYPQNVLAGQLVGFVGHDGGGLEGLERLFDPRLRPQPGMVEYLRDAQYQPLWIESTAYRPQRDGQFVQLALDLRLQSIAQEHLAEAVTRYGAVSGQMIVMDPYSGEILAMATHPSFDPAQFADLPAEIWRNRCVTDIFEPGSIFKPFVWSAVTELQVMNPQELVDCTTTGYWITPYGRRLRDARPKGLLTWDEVLVQSSNIGMAKAAEKLTARQLFDIVSRFGFGQSTGSGLPGETDGVLHPHAVWTRYSQSSVPIGQEIGVSALQITRAFCTFANDGLLIRPRVKIAHQNIPPNPIPVRVLSAAAAAKTRFVLRQVVAEGTGRKANSKLYEIFGKTGTAQLPDFENGGYHQNRYVSSFMAGAPYDQPRLIVGCFIHQPDRAIGHYGGTVAAPAVMRVLEQSLLYLGVPPKTTDDTINTPTLYAHGESQSLDARTER